MKGTFFRTGLEFRLQVQGESFSPEQKIEGSLECISRGGDPSVTTQGTLEVRLGTLSEKKLKAKSPDAFEVAQVVQVKGAS